MVIGTVAIVLALIVMFFGMPIALALFMSAVIGVVYTSGWDTMLGSLGALAFVSTHNYAYSVIPAFVLLGQIGYSSGLLDNVFEIARRWVGRMTGGLAMAVVAANSVFAACSGSSVAACVVIGKSAIPIMRKAGYSEKQATGVVAASGTLSALIPPSITIVIYGLIVDESIGKLLVAGIIPGIVSAALYIGFIRIVSRKITPSKEIFTVRERLSSLKYMGPVIALVVSVMGSILAGIATPTEAGSLGACLIFLLALLSRKMTWKLGLRAVKETITTSCMVLIIVTGAIFFSRFLVMSGFNRSITEYVAVMDVPRVVIFMMVIFVYFLFGCFVGGTGMMVMTLPIFYPLMMNLGFDSLWFGIIVVKCCEMAYITPPVGVNLYAIKGVVPGASIINIIRGSAPFLSMDLLTIAIFYIFPELVTFLPSLM